MVCNGYVAGRIVVSQSLAITYKMYVQQPTKIFCNFMQKRLAKNNPDLSLFVFLLRIICLKSLFLSYQLLTSSRCSYMLFGSLGLDIVSPQKREELILMYALSDYFGCIISYDLVRHYTAPCLMSHTPQRCYHSALIIYSRLPREPTRFFCIRRLSSLRIIYSGLTVSRRIFIIKNSSRMLFFCTHKESKDLTFI